MNIDYIDFSITAVRVLVLVFTAFMTVRHMKNKGDSIILFFFLYATVCFMMCDLYWVALTVLKPDIRLPISVSDAAELGGYLLYAAMLSCIFKKDGNSYRTAVLLTAVFAVISTILWISWSSEWTKDITGGIVFGYFMCVVILSLKRSGAFEKKTTVLIGTTAFILAGLEAAGLSATGSVYKIIDMLCYIILFSGALLMISASVIRVLKAYFPKTKRTDSCGVDGQAAYSDTKKALAVSMTAYVWIQNVMFMSSEPMYYAADIMCTFILVLIMLSVLWPGRDEADMESSDKGGSTI